MKENIGKPFPKISEEAFKKMEESKPFENRIKPTPPKPRIVSDGFVKDEFVKDKFSLWGWLKWLKGLFTKDSKD